VTAGAMRLTLTRGTKLDKNYHYESRSRVPVVTVSSHPMAKALRESYEAMFRGDLEPSRKLFWADCVMHIPGRTPISGDVHGWDESVRWGQRFFERGGKTFGEEVLGVVADDDWAFMLTNYHAERNGRKVEDKSVNVYRLKDGRVAETWVLLGDNRVFEQIFG